jgi:hypothetical protein
MSKDMENFAGFCIEKGSGVSKLEDWLKSKTK